MTVKETVNEATTGIGDPNTLFTIIGVLFAIFFIVMIIVYIRGTIK